MTQRHDRSAPEPACSLHHRVLVPSTDGYQCPTACKASDDLQRRSDVSQCWHSDHDGIWPVPLGRGQPVREWEVSPQVDDG